MVQRTYVRDSGKKKGSRLPYFVFGFFALGFIALIIIAFAGLAMNGPLGGDCVAVVEINGAITTDSVPSSMFSEGVYGSYEISRQISSLNDKDEVKSVLLVVNSPGGSIVASDEIYRAVDSLEAPTVAYFREMAASGGYLVSLPSDYIISEPNALTGSIGVIMYLYQFGELADKLGIEEVVIKSGEMKDIGNPMRNMTQEEYALLEEAAMEMFDDFESRVRAQRGERLNNALFAQALDGRVLTGRMALKAGLVDELGSREDALMKAADLGGIEYGSVSDITVCRVRTSPEPAGLFDVGSLMQEFFASSSFLRPDFRWLF